MKDPSIVEKLIPGVTNVRVIAQGGQKLVFRAQHSKYGEVVLKFILDASSDERIKREIEISTMYKIPNVPVVFDWGYIKDGDDEVLYMTEEYVDGVTLRQYLNERGKVSLSIGLGLLECLLVTAKDLELNRLVHRDIKPENIMVQENNNYYLLDFGIARQLDGPSLTATHAHFGPHTPGYAAPEQFRNLKKEIDIRADLFSIGVVVYEALSGQHPFRNGSNHPLDVLRQTETITPLQFSIPGDSQRQLMGFISILMDKFYSRRPKTAKQALEWYHALLPTVKID